METAKFQVVEPPKPLTPLMPKLTRGSAMAEGLRDALVSKNSATKKYPYHMALFA